MVVLTMDDPGIAPVWGWVVVLTMDGLGIAPVWGCGRGLYRLTEKNGFATFESEARDFH